MTRQLNDGRLVDSLGSARRDAAHISTLTISYPSLSLFLGGEAITQTKTASHCRKFTLSDLSRRSTDRISGIVASIDYSTSTAVSHGPRVCLSLSSEAQKIEKEKTTTRRLGQKAFVLWNLSGCHWDGRRVVPPYCNKGTGGTHREEEAIDKAASPASIKQTKWNFTGCRTRCLIAGRNRRKCFQFLRWCRRRRLLRPDCCAIRAMDGPFWLWAPELAGKKKLPAAESVGAAGNGGLGWRCANSARPSTERPSPLLSRHQHPIDIASRRRQVCTLASGEIVSGVSTAAESVGLTPEPVTYTKMQQHLHFSRPPSRCS